MKNRREWLGEWRQDVRYAWRAMGQQPSFTIAAVLTLGLGIGGTTAIFSLVYHVALKPLPIPEVSRLMVIGDGREGGGLSSVSVGNYTDYKRDTKAFETLTATYSASFNLNLDANPERLSGTRVDADYFRLMQIPAALGRVFTSEEDQPGANHVAVLSDRLWRRRFGGDPAGVGRTITLDGIAVQVIGVMPPTFQLYDREDLWVPAAFTAAQKAQHDEHFLEVFGRLKPGVTVEQALADQDRISRRLEEAFPDDDHQLRGSVQPLFGSLVGDAPERLAVLFGAVLVVLLIGCTNVANLLLARGAARERELAVRAALGAGRRRIVRQLVTENVVLAVSAGALGVALAAGLIRAIVATAPANIPRLDQAGLDGGLLLFAFSVSLGSVLLFGLVPALRSARPDLAQALREGAKGSSSQTSDWLRSGLVAAEVSLSLMLLVGAGLLVRTAIHLAGVDPGFRPEGLQSARVGLPRDTYREWSQVTGAFSRLHDELLRQPGVEAAGLSSQVPLGPGGGSNGLIPEGKTLAAENAIEARLRLVTPGYFAAMGIPLAQGRDITAEDRQGSPRVMIVSKRLAAAAWPGQNPIGKRMACCEGSAVDPMWKEVIGVAGDVRSIGVDRDAEREFYLPMAQTPAEAWNWIQRTMTVVVRGKNPTASTTAIREAMRAVDPGVPIYGIATMDQRIGQSLADSRFNTRLLSALGLIGLMLSAVGIYGVIGYFVTRQTRELGIRMALGASASQIRRQVMVQGLYPTGIGLGLGTLGSLLLTRVLASQLRGVERYDPLTFGVVAGLLALVAVLATLVPARRATRVDPTSAMRED